MGRKLRLAILLCAAMATAVAQGKVNIKTGSLPQARVGSEYSATLEATGGNQPYTWVISSGALPAGLALSAAGVISGITIASGSFDFTVQVIDANRDTDTQRLRLTVGAPPPVAVTTASLPAGTVGTPYSQALAASGGVAPYRWSLAGGALPAGLTLDPAQGPSRERRARPDEAISRSGRRMPSERPRRRH